MSILLKPSVPLLNEGEQHPPPFREAGRVKDLMVVLPGVFTSSLPEQRS